MAARTTPIRLFLNSTVIRSRKSHFQRAISSLDVDAVAAYLMYLERYSATPSAVGFIPSCPASQFAGQTSPRVS